MSFLKTPRGEKLFEAYLKKFKGKSSQKVYRSEIKQFFIFFTGDLLALNGAVFIEYRDYLSRNTKAKTIKRKFSILNQFFKFIEKSVKGFRSPIGRHYGDMQVFEAANYADSEAFQNLLKHWAESLITESTRQTYCTHVRLFFSWFKKDPKELGQDDLSRYRDHLLLEKKLKRSTIWNKFIAINGLLKFLSGKSRKFKNPMNFKGLSLVPPKKDTGYYTVLTEKEVKKLLKQPDRRTLIGKRDQAILRLMLTYGLRVNEITKIRYGDLENERVRGQQKIWVRDRKGRIGRRADTDIVLNGKALDAFDDWMESSKIRFENGTPIFAGFVWDVREEGLVINHSRVRQQKPLTVRTLENVVSKYVQAAGIERNNQVISPHAFRHTAFTFLAKAGIELVDLKFLAGHQDVSTTMIYLHSVQSYDDHVGMHNPINKY